jgi:hypothetical protein
VAEVEVRANRRGAVVLVTRTGLDWRFELDVGPRPVANGGLVSLREVLGFHATVLSMPSVSRRMRADADAANPWNVSPGPTWNVQGTSTALTEPDQVSFR